jgi:hypothetical protein
MNRKHKLIASLVAVPLTIGAGYYFISPKAIVSNLSEKEYDELIISLPSSRISFGPIEAQNSSTILYSRQHQAGMGTYSLRSEGSEIFCNSFSYAEGNEFGRVLHFTIDSNGQVSVND